MLDQDQITAASRTLRNHWRAGTKIRDLDASHRPRDRAEGYAIQAALEHSSAAKLYGWKIAATSAAGQKHINVDGPMAGRILAETVIADGGTASMTGNEMRVGAGAAQIIADNACAHLFVLGAPATSNWRALDLVEEKPVIQLRGETFIGHGKNVLGDPLLALTWLANELRQLGVTLRAGQIVTTGTCHPPLLIQAGDMMEADFGVIGRVSVRFA
jgi:2-keto-4-pentenoate hydratase